AEIRSDGGSNSNGDLVLERSDYLEPNATVETSMPHYSNNIPANVIDWNRKSFFWSSRPPVKGDHLTVTFDQPQNCTYIEARTGKLNQANQDIITGGTLEVSTDGKTFTKLADFEFGTAKGTTDKAIKALRIRATEDEKTSWLIIQDIILK
ncbi:MAG: discoidin domain-containing protein, partial [Anaerohalosphaera sp.]|nr:discoidin domain-containing protein [Anaerohalosphaera sp.]